jgi:GNAT superfamily N-acetyltransferase
VLARAFVGNPLHIAAFGWGQLAVNEAFFRFALAALKGTKLAALAGDRLLGVVHWVEAPACQPASAAGLRIGPEMAAVLGAGPARNVAAWLSAWSRRDPVEPHLHLGPIGVEPEAQGRRLGRALMEAYCAECDKRGILGYLETDRCENVAFYERFGFDLAAEAQILGVPNYFMRRRATASQVSGDRSA